MNTAQSRRTFLQRLASGTLVLGLGGIPASCTPFWEAIQNRPRRRNIATLPPNDPIIQAFKAAVNAMKALPMSDGRNWTRQAQIHLNHCPHGNWFFLPWHRAYLFYFEQICRQLTGMQDFALPYWNWTSSRAVPAPFWGGAANPLFNGTRTKTPTDEAPLTSIGPTVVNNILNQPNFLIFASGQAAGQRDASSYGQLEATPHNSIHGFVGGEMGTYMSPLDPVFWAHHNMIECCWVDWNIVRGHPNTNDTQWTQFPFNGNFFDGSGSPVDITVLQTLLMPLLSYQYEDCSPAFRVTDALRDYVRLGALVRLDYLARAPLRQRVEVAVGRPVSLAVPIEPQRVATAAARQTEERVLLTVGDVTLPRNGDFYVNVFINRPDASPDAGEGDPHFAGSFAFFVDARHHPGGTGDRPDFVLDVTDTVARLTRAGRLAQGGPLTVQLVPVPFGEQAPAEGRFSLEFVEVAVVRSQPGREDGGRVRRDTLQ